MGRTAGHIMGMSHALVGAIFRMRGPDGWWNESPAMGKLEVEDGMFAPCFETMNLKLEIVPPCHAVVTQMLKMCLNRWVSLHFFCISFLRLRFNEYIYATIFIIH